VPLRPKACGGVKKSCWALAAMVAVMVGAAILPSTAQAQVSGTIAVQNDDRFRGRSVSEGEPVVIASVFYDHDSGVSAGGSAVVTSNGPDVGLLRASGHVTFAHKFDSDLSLDGGLVVQSYTDRYSSGRAQTFAEVFGGVTYGQFALHAIYSPSYLDHELQTLYIEFDAVQELGSGFRANARAGVITRLAGEGSFGGEDTRYDAQIGVTKDFDRLSLYLNASIAGSGRGTYFSGPWQGRDAVIVGISRSF